MRHSTKHHEGHAGQRNHGTAERSEERGSRRRHGDVRVALLMALEQGSAHGYELGQRIARDSGGSWELSAGSIYPTLQRLGDEERVMSEERDGRRTFTLTSTGRAELAERRKRGGRAPWEGQDENIGELREAVHALKYAARQVAAVGSKEQRARATELVTDARRALYALLAEAVGE
jgi:DNA-binding PadR family transcriptional regulator